MRRLISVVFLIFFTFLWTFAAGEDVPCIFMENCILPCSFDPGPETVIHWKQGNKVVHSYFYDANQLSHQDQHFRGRTSLFDSEILSGNVSLQLKKVVLQDGGEYRCYTSTVKGNKEQHVNVIVKALVDKVNIDKADNKILCSSEGIYPEPQLTWSISPLSTVPEQSKPVIRQNEQQLFTIRSSLKSLDNVTEVKYSCNISNQNSWRRATLVESVSVHRPDNETTIPCAAPQTPLTSFIWKFNQTHIIVNQTGPVSANWSQKVKVSASGSLILKDLTPDEEGTYTCELTDDKEMYKNNVFLRIEDKKEESSNYLWIIIGVVAAVLVFSIAAVVLYRIRSNGQIGEQNAGVRDEHQMEPLRPG